MEFVFDVNAEIWLNNITVEADDEASARALVYDLIDNALSQECNVKDIELSDVDFEITEQEVKAEVTNIQIYEEHLQHLVPKKIEVTFDYSKPVSGSSDRLDLEVEEATELELNKIPGLEDVIVDTVDYKIIWTESGLSL